MGTATTVGAPAPDDFELRMSLADALRCLDELRERLTDAGVRYAAICRPARGAIRGDVEAARGYVTAALRTAQRYIRLARHLPALTSNTTRVSPTTQAEAARSIRSALFGTARAPSTKRLATTSTAVPAMGAALTHDPIVTRGIQAASRIAALATAGLERLAASLRGAMTPGDAAATYIVERVDALAADFRMDATRAPQATSTPQMLYFAEALGADRVKIGVAHDPIGRLASLQTACPHPLKLLGKVRGTRELEAAIHARLADFHLGGEWFHLGAPVRALIARLCEQEANESSDNRPGEPGSNGDERSRGVSEG